MSFTRAEELPLATINPFEVPVKGWERRQEPRIVWALVQSIKLGRNIRPVFVDERPDGSYNLNNVWTNGDGGFPPIIDGGHHRTLAHIIAEAPMKVRLANSGTLHKSRIRKACPIIDTTFKERRLDYRDYTRSHPWAVGPDYPPVDIDFMYGQLEKAREYQSRGLGSENT